MTCSVTQTCCIDVTARAVLNRCYCLMNNENKTTLITAELLAMTCFSSLTCSCENFLIMVKFYAQYCVHTMVKLKESQEICT